MATAYDPVSSYSSVEVLGPNASQDVEVVTLSTKPSGVIATIPVLRSEFDNGTTGPLLTTFATNIETILGQGKAVGGTAKTELDTNGLLEYYVTFTVAYTPAGAPPNQLTADVDVPIGLLSSADAEIGATLMQEAEAKISAAYDNLVALTKG